MSMTTVDSTTIEPLTHQKAMRRRARDEVGTSTVGAVTGLAEVLPVCGLPGRETDTGAGRP